MNRPIQVLLLSVALGIHGEIFPADLPVNSAAASLVALEARASKENTYPDATPIFHQEIIALIESNTLESGADFYRAGMMASGAISDFRTARMQYELMLAAAAKSNPEAEKELMQNWDNVLSNLGRSLRFDSFGLAASHPENFSLEAAPPAIQAVFRNPVEARTVAVKTTDNTEVQKIVDADQGIRKNWNKLSDAEWANAAVEDLQRNTRIRAIVAEGALHTARDFANASLVMQHSPGFAGFELAHELAVCSMLLGDRGIGRWLIAATYDRMLNSVGHDQRFGTQARGIGHQPPSLRETDEAGICDHERLALGCPTLAAKRASFTTAKPSNETH